MGHVLRCRRPGGHSPGCTWASTSRPTTSRVAGSARPAVARRGRSPSATSTAPRALIRFPRALVVVVYDSAVARFHGRIATEMGEETRMHIRRSTALTRERSFGTWLSAPSARSPAPRRCRPAPTPEVVAAATASSASPGTTTRRSAGRSGTSRRSRRRSRPAAAATSPTTPSLRPRRRRATSRTSSPRAPTSSSSSPRTARRSCRRWPAPPPAACRSSPTTASSRIPARCTSRSTTSKLDGCRPRSIYELVPEGNYIIIKGNSADANADFLRAGYEEVIGEAVEAGDITIVGEDYTDNWDPAIAQTTTEQFLTDADNDVQAVLSENDGMAGGVVAALEAQGLAGQVPVSGQDGDLAALNRVALGTQTVDVWKDCPPARHGGRRGGHSALREPRHHRRRRHRSVRVAWRQRADVDPARADPDHPGQPRRRRSMPGGSIRRRCARVSRPGTVAVCDAPAGSAPADSAPADSAPADTASMDTAPASTGG